MNKLNTNKLEEIAEKIRLCKDCPLHKERLNAVPGSGNPNAKLIIIGEAPGAKEDKEGLPFIGSAGKILNQGLEQANLSRDDVFITNTVKCRPPENRDPSKLEKEACKKHLEAQIKEINPQIYLLLGNHSLQKEFPDKKVTDTHGQFLERDGKQFFCTFHPAATIYNQKLRPLFFEDIAKLTKRI